MLCVLCSALSASPLPNPLYTPTVLHRAPHPIASHPTVQPSPIAILVPRPIFSQHCRSRFTPTSLPAPPTNHVRAARQHQKFSATRLSVHRAHEPCRRVNTKRGWRVRVLSGGRGGGGVVGGEIWRGGGLGALGEVGSYLGGWGWVGGRVGAFGGGIGLDWIGSGLDWTGERDWMGGSTLVRLLGLVRGWAVQVFG